MFYGNDQSNKWHVLFTLVPLKSDKGIKGSYVHEGCPSFDKGSLKMITKLPFSAECMRLMMVGEALCRQLGQVGNNVGGASEFCNSG